jgi:D-alanyl-D-alanine dipeptidase
MVPPEIVLLTDPRVLAVSILDNGEPLVDLRSVPEIVVDPRNRNLSSSFAMVRLTVARHLISAQRSLPEGFRFLIIEAHRPIPVQRSYFELYATKLASVHSDWDQARILAETIKYVAPPHSVPPHSTGGAIDLTLVDAAGQELDMGTSVNDDPEDSGNACFTMTAGIAETARIHRKLLIDALSAMTFVNYPTEWWHWSYGDRYWAYHLNRDHAIYGAVG